LKSISALKIGSNARSIVYENHIRGLEWCTGSSHRCAKCNFLARAGHFAAWEPS
jgi:hypothetical protein